MSKHTSTPWRNPSGSVSVFANHNQKICDLAWFNKDTQEAEANAAFIVRACNAHQDLLEACKRAMAVLAEGKSVNGKAAVACNILSDAIATAEGQS